MLMQRATEKLFMLVCMRTKVISGTEKNVVHSRKVK